MFTINVHWQSCFLIDNIYVQNWVTKCEQVCFKTVLTIWTVWMPQASASLEQNFCKTFAKQTHERLHVGMSSLCLLRFSSFLPQSRNCKIGLAVGVSARVCSSLGTEFDKLAACPESNPAFTPGQLGLAPAPPWPWVQEKQGYRMEVTEKSRAKNNGFKVIFCSVWGQCETLECVIPN